MGSGWKQPELEHFWFDLRGALEAAGRLDLTFSTAKVVDKRNDQM
jgi:hypothetical protein